ISLQPGHIKRRVRHQSDANDVEGLLFIFVQAVADLKEILSAMDDSFTKQKPGSQLEVGSRGSHGNSDALLGQPLRLPPAEPDLQRFLDREHVIFSLPGVTGESNDGLLNVDRR